MKPGHREPTYAELQAMTSHGDAMTGGEVSRLITAIRDGVPVPKLTTLQIVNVVEGRMHNRDDWNPHWILDEIRRMARGQGDTE